MPERKIKVKSGRYEAWMEVSEEEYQRYFRPWWQQKKQEQRKREVMEKHGFREESYEEWKENDMRSELFSDSLEDLTEKKEILGILQEALESLMPEEKELVQMVFGEEMQVSEYAKLKGECRTTISSRKQKALEKMRTFFVKRGFDVRE